MSKQEAKNVPAAGTILKSLASGKDYVVLPIDYPAEDTDLILVRIELGGRLATKAFWRRWQFIQDKVVKAGSWESFLPLARQMPISNRSIHNF